MRLKKLMLLMVAGGLVVALNNAGICSGKRSRGRSRGSSAAGSLWSSRRHSSNGGQKGGGMGTQSQSQELSASAPNTKNHHQQEASALRLPQESAAKQQAISNQQSALGAPNNQNPQRPIGWNVAGPNHHLQGFPDGHHQHQSYPSNYQTFGSASLPQSHGTPYYSGAYPNTGSGQYYGTSANAYGSGGHQYNPHQPFQGYYPTSNIGVIPPQGANAGHYYNSISGLGGNSHLYAGHHGGGIFGALFGGKKQAGYGGLGGYGGYGYPGGYGMGGLNRHGKSHGLFGKNAYRNVLAGVLIWTLLRGAVSTPYYVYSYHHRPPWLQEEMSLPASVLVLCGENATNLCAPGTVPLCTANATIFCVATATVPCGENASAPCVNTTIPCLEENDPLCNANNNSTGSLGNNNNTTNMQLPCISNVTVEAADAAHHANQGGRIYCVTTIAIPQQVEENQNSTTTAAANNNSKTVSTVVTTVLPLVDLNITETTPTDDQNS